MMFAANEQVEPHACQQMVLAANSQGSHGETEKQGMQRTLTNVCKDFVVDSTCLQTADAVFVESDAARVNIYLEIPL